MVENKTFKPNKWYHKLGKHFSVTGLNEVGNLLHDEKKKLKSVE